MKKFILTLMAAAGMTLAMAQNPGAQGQNGGTPPQMPQRMTVDEINAKMQNDLQLTADQLKQVQKLNKKYSTLYEGSSRSGGGMGGGRPGGMGGGAPMGGGGDMMGGGGAPMGGGAGMGGNSGVRFTPSTTTPEQLQRKQELQQQAYEKKLKKILTDEQYATYEKTFPALMMKMGQGGPQGAPGSGAPQQR